MKRAFFAAEIAFMAAAAPFAAVATVAGGVTIWLAVISHVMHLRGDRWGRQP